MNATLQEEKTVCTIPSLQQAHLFKITQLKPYTVHTDQYNENAEREYHAHDPNTIQQSHSLYIQIP